MYNFSKCVRLGHISPDEIHPCYFCGQGVKVSSPIYCKKCGMWKCSFCNKCYCDATSSEKKLLIDLHRIYCRNYNNLINFQGVADDSVKVSVENTTLFNNVCNALLNCAEILRCQDQ